MSTSGVVKNMCCLCGKGFSEGEKAFLIAPVKTDTIQYNETIGINRIGTSKRDLLHVECRGKNDDRTVELGERIQKALNVAISYGTTDGDHHKMWVIDQMIRELTGCPTLKTTVVGMHVSKSYDYEYLGESEAYKEFVRSFEDGQDVLETYSWDEGCPP